MSDFSQKKKASPHMAEKRRAALLKKEQHRRMKLQKRIFIAISLTLLFLISMGTSACITRIRKARETSVGAQEQSADLKKKTKTSDKEAPPKEIDLVDATKNTSITISVVGDCTLGTDDNFDYSTSLNAYFDSYGSSYFLQNVLPIFSEDDLTIANFEGTLTDSNAREDKLFAFKAPASFAKILTDGKVEAVTTANNHSHDYGEEGFTDTLQALDSENIVHFGYDETSVLDIKGVKVGLVGIYELRDHLGRIQQVKDNIRKVKDAGAELVIVIFHWGNEKEQVPDDNQMTLGRLAIDEGADLVCGHHPHVLQGIETYKGKNIVYSLGNFCFGGNSAPSDMDSMIFQQTFTITNDGVQKDNKTNIIPCSISSEYGYNNYQPTPSTGEEAQRILSKIRERSSYISLNENGVSFQFEE